MDSLGDIIRRARKEKKLTTTELAELVDLTQGYISHIENNRKSPSYETLNKLSQALNTPYLDLMVAAGYYTDEELQQIKEIQEFHESMTPEQKEDYIKEGLKDFVKYSNIQQYQERFHVQIEDFLKDKRKNFYINGHKLTHKEIKSLMTLYGEKEKNYPSHEQIEKEYEEIKKKREDISRRSEEAQKDGKFYFEVDYDYDINTNEDIKNK